MKSDSENSVSISDYPKGDRCLERETKGKISPSVGILEDIQDVYVVDKFCY